MGLQDPAGMQVWLPSSLLGLLPSCGISSGWLRPWCEGNSAGTAKPTCKSRYLLQATLGTCSQPGSSQTSHESGLGWCPESLLPIACPRELLVCHGLCKVSINASSERSTGDKLAPGPSFNLFAVYTMRQLQVCCLSVSQLFCFSLPFVIANILWKVGRYYVTFYRKDNCCPKAKWLASMEKLGLDSAVAIWNV